jgi:predicted acyltransferase (DUF342 family)
MMASNYMTYAAFALVCLLLLTLPFIPAFREWRYPSDVSALPVSANYTSDIDHFSRRLALDVAAKLGRGPATGFEDFDFVSFPIDKMQWQKTGKRLIAQQSINTQSPIKSASQLYVEGDLQSGEKSVFSSLYATGDIALGDGSEVRDWSHAEGVFRLGGNGMALRRISAGVAIELGNEVWFERLQAPTLSFGLVAKKPKQLNQHAQTPASYADLPNAVEQTPLLFLIRGDCALPAGRIYQGSLVVTGFLTVGQDTTVLGDIKARVGVSIARRARVEGAITCEKRVYVFKDAAAWGPIVSESDILIGARAMIGLPDALTTVTAQNIIIEEGAMVHGAVWAHEIGMVKAE